MSKVESGNLRVRVACRPNILNHVLVEVLRIDPEILLVGKAADEPADVVITTGHDPNHPFGSLDGEPTPTKLLVTIDRDQNTLYVRRMTRGSVGVEILAGDISVLRELLNREV